MRVLVVLGRSTGGIGRHVGSLVTGLRAEGHEVAVVTDASTARRFGWSDAKLLWPFHPGLSAARGLVDWHRIMLLARSADVVHAHGHQAAFVAAVAVARARPRPRFVVSLHNDLPRGGTHQRAKAAATKALEWALRRADLVTVASADLVDLVRRLGATAPVVAEVVSPTVGELLDSRAMSEQERDALLSGAGLDPRWPLVLTVSRIAPQKDLDVLIAAARESACPATWVVIGDGAERLRAELEAQADGIRTPDDAPKVTFLGARDDVPDWLRTAAVFVLTSRWEARALVVQEAMAAGLPVVATRTGGLPGLVADAGCLVPVGDSSAIALEVDRLIADPAARERLGNAARRVAGSWPSTALEARRWTERYEGTLDS